MEISLNNITVPSITRNLENNTRKLSKKTEKLSSGYRITCAADDPSGLAVSEKLKVKVNGITRANKNIQDGISLFQTAEGGLEQIQRMLQRMRVLALQSTNDTLTTSDRTLLQQEVSQLICEVDRLTTSVEFNGWKLLVPNTTTIPGTPESSGTTYEYKSLGLVTPPFGVSDNSFDLDSAGITQTDKVKIQFTTSPSAAITADAITDTATGRSAGVTGLFIPGTAHPAFDDPDELNGLWDGALAGYFPPPSTTDPVVWAEYQLSSTIINGAGYDITIVNNAVSAPAGSTMEVFAWGETSYTIPATPDTTTGEEITNFQIGPDSSDSFDVSLPDLSNDSLNIDNIDISTRSGAESALTSLDTSINQISQSRATIGAQINRLESILNTSQVAQENYTEAQSRIKDTDYAAELIEYTKLQIFTRTGTALAAQAGRLLRDQILTIIS